jgi:glycerol-3-phosphate O-acyltransferase
MLSDLITPEIKLTIESVNMPEETNALPQTDAEEEQDE